MIWLEAIAGFFIALPKLLKLYESIVRAVGLAQANKALEDLDESSRLVEASKKEGLSIEEKRALRIEALKKGRDLWGRMIG